MIRDSVSRTGRAVVAHEAVRFGGFGAELSAQIQELAFDFLLAPVQRVGAPFMPVPLSPPLEDAYRPGADDVYAAARFAIEWDQPDRHPDDRSDQLMRAAVTEGVGSVAVLDREEPPAPGAGEVLLAPEAVGICGSDYHFFLGELSDEAGGSQFPRVLGHEVGARILAVGPGCRDELTPGPARLRVAADRLR